MQKCVKQNINNDIFILKDGNSAKKLFEQAYPGQLKFKDKILGQGGYGKIYDIVLGNSVSGAGKIIKNEEKTQNEINISSRLKGRNIIRNHALYKASKGQNDYCLFVMEKANLSDLNKLNDYIKNKNLLRTIYNPFNKNFNENLLRLYIKQIVSGLETIRRYGLVHLDLKPQNFLVTYNLCIKLADYTLTKSIKDLEEKGNQVRVTAGTNGFLPPEYYSKKPVDIKMIDKVDIFELGASIYKLATDNYFLDVPKDLNDKLKIKKVKNLYDRNMKRIDSLVNEGVDKDFVNLLKKMLKFNPEDRIDFEFIYRNKWVNKNSKEIDKILQYYVEDEEKAIMELQKSDLLFKYYEDEKNNKKCKYKLKIKKKKFKRKTRA